MQARPTTTDQASQVAAQFLDEVPAALQEQSGGLSGARVWRVESLRGTFVLRQYPTEYPTQGDVQWLHRLMKEVQDRGCSLLPCPVPLPCGTTWIEQEKQIWELLTWVQGEPFLETIPSRELLCTATAALARLHAVTEKIQYSPLIQPGVVLRGVGRGIQERARLAHDWNKADASKVQKLLTEKSFSAAIHRLFKLQQAALQDYGASLAQVLETAFRAHDRKLPVLRDVQPGHVLFRGDSVAGFIDLAAARADSAMGDLARLLQRWRFAEPTWYADAVESYHSIRPLSSDERMVLFAYDFSARLLTGVQWLKWLVIEEREFTNQTLVETHLQRAERDLLDLLE